jgi:hypothetical protein
MLVGSACAYVNESMLAPVILQATLLHCCHCLSLLLLLLQVTKLLVDACAV